MLEYFTDPHPDELLYSIWARYSDHVHFSAKTDALWELFGSRGIIPIVDLPGRIQCFVDRLPEGHCYDADFFIDNHTLFPYYQAVLPNERRKIARREMILGIGKSIHGLAGSNTKILPPVVLRFCPKCVEEDRRKFGECYWHRLHQLPGVEVCPLHEMLLENSTIRARSGGMTPLGLVSAVQALKKALPSRTSTFPNFDILLHIAQESAYLLEHPHLTLDIIMLTQKYRAILALQGFLTWRGRIRVYDLFQAFEKYYAQELLSSFQCNLQLARGNLNRQWLGKIIALSESSGRVVLHPLYHILSIRFLGFTLETILSQEIAPFGPFGTGPWPCLNPVCEYFQQRVISSYRMPETHRKKGIIRGTFSCQCGYTYNRSGPDSSPDGAFRKGNVLSYGPVWDAKFRELWQDSSVPMYKMAPILGISRDSLASHARRLHLPVPRNAPSAMAEEEILPQSRGKGKDREWYRQQWLTLVENSPGETAGALVRKAKGVRSWLKRHDLEWYNANRPAKIKDTRKQLRSKPFQSREHWRKFQGRDARLATAAREVYNKLVLEQDPPKRISKRRICREIPELRSIPNPKGAPLTTQVLKEVTETHEAFALRRIDWYLHQYLVERVSPSKNAFIERANLRGILHHQNVEQALDIAINVLSQFA
jgi:Tn7-like transposition protein D/TniQ